MRINSKFRERKTGKIVEVIDSYHHVVFISDGSETLQAVSTKMFKRNYVEPEKFKPIKNDSE